MFLMPRRGYQQICVSFGCHVTVFWSNHVGEKYLMDYNYLFPREGFQPFQTIILRRDFY